jgi:transposase
MSNVRPNPSYCTVVRTNPIDTHLYLVKQKPKGRHRYNQDGSRTTRGQSEKMAKRQKEPWLITTSLCGDQRKAKQIVNLYKTRMQIEEAFRDTKSHRIGFSLSESMTRNRQRLNILLLIGALATFISWLIGMLAELKQWNRQFQSNSNKKRRVLSTFFIGCQVIREKHFRLCRREYEKALLQVRTNASVLCYA